MAVSQADNAIAPGHQFSGETLRTQVCIIGSGAGGAVAADKLSAAGLEVIILEAGPWQTASDFHNDEAHAWSQLYQDGALQMTDDGQIVVLQGRAGGGSPTINWTSCFRTPDATLNYWAQEFGLTQFRPRELTPWFEEIEQQLNIHRWQVPPNPNNTVLERGCTSLGWHHERMLRNVKGCRNLGFCGTGCPYDAKQNMSTVCLPAAFARGTRLLHSTRAMRLVHDEQQASRLIAQPLAGDFQTPAGQPLTIQADHFIVAGGAIHSPALLLRSAAPDPFRLLGKRTFLHPVPFSAATFADPIHGYYGAPQSVYSDEFIQATDERPGFKLEVVPLQPGLTSAMLGGHGHASALRMNQLSHQHVGIALLADGFHPASLGGSVSLTREGRATLQYPMTDYLWHGIQQAWLAMGELQFAAGARAAWPGHSQAELATSWQEYQNLVQKLPLLRNAVRLASAHVMGGCTMHPDASQGVTRPDGRHQQLHNVSVLDGSLFPTSIGANPQVSVYAMAAMLATQLANDWC